MAKKIKCPGMFCRNTDCVPVTEKKRFSVGKGLVFGAAGGWLLGPLGGAVGIASGLNGKKKVKFMCKKCGRVFTVKI